MDKGLLFQQVREHLEDRRRELERSRDDATSGTRIDHERPANRGERAAVSSQGYLAHGLAQRLATIQSALARLEHLSPEPRDRVALGALVTVADDRGERRLLLLPAGEGLTLESPEGPVAVLSPDAPLVRPLLGLEAGDAGTSRVGGRAVEVEILEVA